MIMLLLDYGADLSIKNIDGLTVCDVSLNDTVRSLLFNYRTYCHKHWENGWDIS